MPTRQKIRYAVVGLNHGKSHVEYTMNNADVEVSALCDTSEYFLNEIGKYALAARKFSDYDEMLAWGEFDAVIIAVPPFLHREFSVKALRADKHVLLEKPLTGNLQDAIEFREEIKDTKLVFQIGYCVRSSQLVQRSLSIIQSGALGNVVNVWWNMFMKSPKKPGWREERAKFGGKLLDCGCHYFDILQLFAGAPFHRLTAYGHEPGKIGSNPDKTPKVAAVIIEYQNGAKGSFNLSEVTPTIGNSASFGIAGTRGIIFGNPWEPSGAGSLKCQLNDGLYLDELTINGEIASTGHLGFREQHQAFINTIRCGKGNPCTINDACEIELMMSAIDKSLASGKTILREEII